MFKIHSPIIFFLLLLCLPSNTKCQVVGADLVVGAERLDLLLPALQNKKVALVINQTSIVGKNQTLLLDTLLSSGVTVKKIFAPEHGFRGNADAGETVKNSTDIRTGISIASIYGTNKRPTREQLAGIDVVVFDIQDVGARFYTYISTLHYVMEACAENKIKLIVCDRPNPNDFVDGPVLQPSCKSFVGMHPIPVLHGLTVGELAMMINGEKWLKVAGNNNTCDLTVVPVKGWEHGQPYNLPVKPSPNLPNKQSIQLYPSLCFFEATNVSVGRGTTFPFQVLGAPDKKFGSFSFTPRSLPGWDKQPLHQDKICYGVDLRAVKTEKGLDLKYIINFLNISKEGSNFFSRPGWFDLLAGNKKLRQQITSGMSENEIRKTWNDELTQYNKIRTKYLIYKVKD